jgi:hypothetical protein
MDDVPVASSSAMARLTITNVVENDGMTVSNFNTPASSTRMFLASFNDNYTSYLRDIETGNI